jgi:hypothetical protein
MFSKLSYAETEEWSGGWEGATLPASIDRQLADLERRMDELEASEAHPKASVMHRKHTHE